MIIVGGRGFDKEQQNYVFLNTVFMIDVKEGKFEELAELPSAICGHCSSLIDNRYLLLYGGTNGLRFFDSLIRYDLEKKQSLLMVHPPSHLSSSPLLKHGRISCSMVNTQEHSVESDDASKEREDFIVLFGGSSIEREHNEVDVIPVEFVREDKNFAEINEIM